MCYQRHGHTHNPPQPTPPKPPPEPPTVRTCEKIFLKKLLRGSPSSSSPFSSSSFTSAVWCVCVCVLGGKGCAEGGSSSQVIGGQQQQKRKKTQHSSLDMRAPETGRARTQQGTLGLAVATAIDTGAAVSSTNNAPNRLSAPLYTASCLHNKEGLNTRPTAQSSRCS